MLFSGIIRHIEIIRSNKIFSRCLFTMIIGAIVAEVILVTLWRPYMALIHTSFELLCIFIALASFLIIWFTHNVSSHSTRTIGLGFLSVAVFDILHTYFFPALQLYPKGYDDLSARYWIFARLAESIVLLLSTRRFIKARFSKWSSLTHAVAVPVLISILLIILKQIMPPLIKDGGVTFTKVVMEYFVIAILLVSLHLMIRKLNRKSTIEYSYIFMAILISMSSGICFTMFKNADCFIVVYGHILKVVSYFYLLKGIFASTVTYPYEAVKKAKDKLVEAKHELRNIINGLPVALVNYDSDKRVTYANKMALELLECRPEDIMQKSFEQTMEQFSYDKIEWEDFDNILNDGEISVVQKFKSLKGRDINLSMKVFRYNDDILVSFKDAKNEQVLKDLKIQTRTILNAISNSVVITDIDDNIIMYNKAFKQCIEMRDGDIQGKVASNIFNALQMTVNGIPYEFPKHIEKDEQLIEAAFLTSRGNSKYIIINHSPIFNLQDEIIGYIFVYSDITEMKIKQRRILQQEKLAVIGQMGSGIVHETKNHLALVKGYCQLLKRKTSDEQELKYVARIESIVEGINNFVVDFLTIVKPSETKMGRISLNETVCSMQYMLESLSSIRYLQINIELSDKDRNIKADETQIKQVILNIAKNAVEAMEGKENPVLGITTEACDEENKMKLVISDNGKGISKEDLPKIGRLFFTTKDDGTGLGLNMCFKIIEDHAGSIEVESEEGKWTKFIISIPYFNDNEGS